MTARPTVTKAHQDYLDRVRAALADLPAGEVDDILCDVAVQLQESEDPAELERLGSPEGYAAELRVAAGYAAQPGPAVRRSHRGRDGVWTLGLACVLAVGVGFYGTGAGSGIAVVVALVLLVVLPAGLGWLSVHGRSGLRELPEVVAARRGALRMIERVPATWVALAVSLRPAWWVLRAWAVSVLLLRILEVSSTLLAVVLAALLVGPSVWLARTARGDRGWSWIAFPVNLLAVGVLLALPLKAQSYAYASTGTVVDAPPSVSEPGLSVSNIYPFGADGTPLSDVYLYDQDGQPIKVGASTCSDGSSASTTGVDQEESTNRFPLARVVPDPQTGVCTAKGGLPFSVAIPAGTSAPTGAAPTGAAPTSRPAIPTASAPTTTAPTSTAPSSSVRRPPAPTTTG